MFSSEAKPKPAESLQGKEFLVVKSPSMVAASEVLRHLEDYLVLSSVITPNPDRAILPADPVDLQLYAEYVERRAPYIRNDMEAQLPGHIRRLYSQIVEGLRGPEWALSPIDPCFSRSRDEILRELTTIGLTQAAWYYVVDNLPADTIQLRGALLVIMPDKMKMPEWKDQAVARLNRIVELVSRLRFLMRLSRSGPLEREKLFNDLDVPKAPISVQPVSVPDISVQIARRPKDSSEAKSISEPSSLKVQDAARNPVAPKKFAVPALAVELESLDFQFVEGLPSEPRSAGISDCPPVMADRALLTKDIPIANPESQMEPKSSMSVDAAEKSTGKMPARPKVAKKQEIVTQEPTRRSGRAKSSKK